MYRRRIVAAVLMGAVVVAAGSPAKGYPVTWEFGGEITIVADPNDFLGGAVAVGDPFSGTLTFESQTPDGSPEDPTGGFYNDAIVWISGHVAGVAFEGPIQGENYISLLDDLPSPGDFYGVMSAVEILGTPAVFRWTLVDTEANLLSNDHLPLVPPDLSLADLARFEIYSESGAFQGAVAGHFMQLVPEPATLALLGLGWLVLPTHRHPRRSQKGAPRPHRHMKSARRLLLFTILCVSIHGPTARAVQPPDCNGNRVEASPGRLCRPITSAVPWPKRGWRDIIGLTDA